MEHFGLNNELLDDMKGKGIDVELTLSILERINRGEYSSDHVDVESIPTVDNRTIVDLSGEVPWSVDRRSALDRADRLGIADEVRSAGRGAGDLLLFSGDELARLGQLLYPYLSFGILNGGSATSYADQTKNRSFSPELFDLHSELFDRTAPQVVGQPKGLTPAFIQPDGSAGPSFMELKMRAVLIQALVSSGKRQPDSTPTPLLPLFQMTSTSNDEIVGRRLTEYRRSPLLADLIGATGVDITQVRTGVQPLIAAFTHSSEGDPRRIFDRTNGASHASLPLPGGHGQCFEVLGDVFANLRKSGKHFVQIGNVDNIGNIVDPRELAIVALSGSQGGFDFAFRTPVDVKGGILVRSAGGTLTCADIGPAISMEHVRREEEAGRRILFNCATGIFDLDYLVDNAEKVARSIPIRLSDQKKDAGSYAQAEQITWEVIGVLPAPVIFGVRKADRFLAAKLLLESFLTSGVLLAESGPRADSKHARDTLAIAGTLHAGLQKLLRETYGMKLAKQRWVPRTVEEIRSRLS